MALDFLQWQKGENYAKITHNNVYIWGKPIDFRNNLYYNKGRDDEKIYTYMSSANSTGGVCI